MNYRREIDGLRALAVIPVILFHAGFKRLGGGFVGVDVFFVMSGYLITTLILTELASGQFSLSGFYERRARRILPALFLVMAACIPFAWWLLPSNEMNDFSKSLVAVSVFASNLFFMRDTGYFAPAAELKPLLHTWSLAVEEQFYVLFPLFLMLAWRFGRRWLVALLVGLATMSLAVAHWGPMSRPAAAFFLLPPRGWELVLGALVACYLFNRQRPAKIGILNQGLSLVGLLLILFSVFVFSERTPFLNYALAPTIGAALIMLFAWPETLVGTLLGSRALVGIGLISYSAYLWHQPLFAFARQRATNEPGWLLFLLLALASLVLAFISWRFVEQPFRRKHFISRTAVIITFVVATLSFIGFGLMGKVSNGFEMFGLNEAQRKVMLTASSSPKNAQCHALGHDYLKPINACEYHVKDPEWAVLGNSHAVELAYALAWELRAVHQGIKHLTFSACPPSFGRAGRVAGGCAAWTREAVDYIAHNDRISHVVISYKTYLVDPMHSRPASDDFRPVNDVARLKIWKSYVDTVKYLLAAKKQVIVVLQAPQLPKYVQSYIAAEQQDFGFVGGVSRSAWETHSAFIRSRLGDLPEEAIIIDPADFFCNQVTCAAVKDNTALYFDDQHMSVAGSALISAEIIRRTLGPPAVKKPRN